MLFVLRLHAKAERRWRTPDPANNWHSRVQTVSRGTTAGDQQPRGRVLTVRPIRPAARRRPSSLDIHPPPCYNLSSLVLSHTWDRSTGEGNMKAALFGLIGGALALGLQGCAGTTT